MTEQTNPNIEKFDLKGHRLFKMSHGYLLKSPNIKDRSIAKDFENMHWISLSEYTGKGQANKFKNIAKEGDYVYVCYGGWDLLYLGRITSGVNPVETPYDEKIEASGEWIYRQIEVVKEPVDKNVRDLKADRRFHMPSGNSTFYPVSGDVIDEMNDDLFIPKFGIEIVNSGNGGTNLIDPPVTENEEFGDDIEPIHPLNRILYGPPGTGKTFHSISHAVAIIENEDAAAIVQECEDGNREDVRNRFDELVGLGRIKFCTFHQSLGYEDFIEGIKPKEPRLEGQPVIYKIEDGIFKTLCEVASKERFDSQSDEDNDPAPPAPSVAPPTPPLPSSDQYDIYVSWVLTQPPGSVVIDSKFKVKYTIVQADNKNIEVSRTRGNNGKRTKNKIVAYLNRFAPTARVDQNQDMDKLHDELSGDASILWAISNAIRDHYIATITASTAIVPVQTKQTGINVAKKRENRFVLIIDEINRGNISQIFGELITLIEEDKRLGKKEELQATLPYSKKKFGVPSNVYLIGTMNTADRSVEALDTALRRRFSFVHMTPKEEKLKPIEMFGDDGVKISVNLPLLLTKMNERLKVLKDADHTVGHAWLMSVSNLESLQNVFRNSILPLLQEYFYNDYEKLGLVLGDKFFEKTEQVSSKIFASFKSGNDIASQYDQTWQYTLKDPMKLSIADFQSLYA